MFNAGSLILHKKHDSNASLLTCLYNNKDYILITDEILNSSQKKQYKISILVEEICTIIMWMFLLPVGQWTRTD